MTDLTTDQAAIRRRLFANWAAALHEPLLPDATRQAILDGVRVYTAPSPGFLIDWSTGVTATLLSTIPSSDPWRNPGDEFGTARDAADVYSLPDVEPDSSPRSPLLTDPSLSAIADDMPSPSPVVFAACTRSADAGADEFTRHLAEQDGSETERAAWAVTIAEALLVRALWRRRLYEGGEDTYPLTLMYQWLTLARERETGEEADTVDIGLEALSEELPPSAYTDLALPGST